MGDMEISHKVKRYCQTSETNCGPYSLAQLMSYYEKDPDPAAIEKCLKMTEYGILDGYLGQAAIARGYKVTINPRDLYVFDPTWEKITQDELLQKLRAGREGADKGLRFSLDGYIGFLEAGGKIGSKILSRDLLVSKLKRHPLFIGLCSTYLYGIARPAIAEIAFRYTHFVVVNGYDQNKDAFSIVDPYHTIPFSKSGRYQVKSDRLVEAMFLAEATHDCTILEIEK